MPLSEDDAALLAKFESLADQPAPAGENEEDAGWSWILAPMGYQDTESAAMYKWMHKNWSIVGPHLEVLFHTQDHNLSAGLVLLLQSMVVDRVLRDRLLTMDGYLPFLKSLLTRSPSLSSEALEAIVIALATPGKDQLVQLSRAVSRPLVELGRSLEADDERLLVIVTVLKKMCVVKEASSGKTGIDVDESLDFLMTLLSKPVAFAAFANLCEARGKHVLKSPRHIRCLVAFVSRHPHRQIRLQAFRALYQLSQDLEKAHSERFEVRDGAAAARKFCEEDPEMVELLRTVGGVQQTEAFQVLFGEKFFLTLFSELREKWDFKKFGIQLQEAIPRIEFSVAEMAVTVPDGVPHPISGKQGQRRDPNSPIGMATEALPMAAKALRKSEGKHSEKALILDLKYLMMQGRHEEAWTMAKAGLLHHPQCHYLYFALRFDETTESLECYKRVTKGIELKPEAYIGRSLQLSGAMYTFSTGMEALGEGGLDTAWQFFMAAHHHSEVVIQLSAPDAYAVRIQLHRYLLLMILLNKRPRTAELAGLAELIKRAHLLDRLNKVSWKQTQYNMPRMAWVLIEEHFEAATKEWEPIIARFEHEAWTEKKATESEGMLGNMTVEAFMKSIKELSKEGLNFCAHCMYPSAALMKCGRCHTTRYCSRACQKAAFPAHKAGCKRFAAQLSA